VQSQLTRAAVCPIHRPSTLGSVAADRTGRTRAFSSARWKGLSGGTPESLFFCPERVMHCIGP
jgi:hypothetical protein